MAKRIYRDSLLEYSMVIHCFDLSSLFDKCITIPHSGCWIWEKSLKWKEAYHPSTAIRGYNIGYHRASWILFNQKPIPQNYFICHHCDIKNCINPHHLFAGTASDNMKDRYKKGRTSLSKEYLIAFNQMSKKYTVFI